MLALDSAAYTERGTLSLRTCSAISGWSAGGGAPSSFNGALLQVSRGLGGCEGCVGLQPVCQCGRGPLSVKGKGARRQSSGLSLSLRIYAIHYPHVHGGALVMQVPLKRRSASRCPSPVLALPPICIALLASCHAAWDPVPAANEDLTKCARST